MLPIARLNCPVAVLTVVFWQGHAQKHPILLWSELLFFDLIDSKAKRTKTQQLVVATLHVAYEESLLGTLSSMHVLHIVYRLCLFLTLSKQGLSL